MGVADMGIDLSSLAEFMQKINCVAHAAQVIVPIHALVGVARV